MFRPLSAGPLIAALLLAACATAPTPLPSAATQRPVVVGYVQTHHLGATAARPDLGRFTHLNIAFANPDAEGLFAREGAMTCMDESPGAPPAIDAMRSLVVAAHRSGAKVLISVGGGQIPACSGDWAALLRPASRDRVVRELLQLVDRENLDGIDLDLEGDLLTGIDRDGDYVPFVEALGRGLRERGKLLTCATASYEGGMVPRGSVPWFDLVNVMAYDLVGLSWGEPGGEHSPMSQAVQDLALWRARGVPREKLVLGVPFYGYGFGALRGNYSYRDVAARFGDRRRGDVVGERCGGCDYITINGPDTLRAKAHLAMAQGGGVMVWEISQDTDDAVLLDALIDGLVAGRP